MGPDAATLLGAYDALVDVGLPPDIVIGTSGGALAAALIGGIADRRERYQAMLSAEQQAFFLAARVVQPSLVRMGGHIVEWFLRSWMRTTYRPCAVADRASPPPEEQPGVAHRHHASGDRPAGLRRLFTDVRHGRWGNPVFDLPPCHPLPGLHKQLTDVDSPRVALLGGRIPTCNQVPSYVETWFTDHATAKLLRGVRPAIARDFPHSLVADSLGVVTDAALGDAVRASIAEPHFFPPCHVAGASYAGGLVNLWPCEAAASLAHEVIAIANPPCDPIQAALVSATFGYDPRIRMRMIRSRNDTRWIDFSDATRSLRRETFWFGISVVHGRRLAVPRIVSRVPHDPERFRAMSAAQYRYGYDRVVSGVDAPRASGNRVDNATPLPPIRDFKGGSSRAPSW